MAYNKHTYQKGDLLRATDLNNTEDEVEVLDVEVEGLKTKATAAETSISTLNSEVSALNTSTSTLNSEVTTLQTVKQDKLTAGKNITITDNTIAAADGVNILDKKFVKVRKTDLKILNNTGDIQLLFGVNCRSKKVGYSRITKNGNLWNSKKGNILSTHKILNSEYTSGTSTSDYVSYGIENIISKIFGVTAANITKVPFKTMCTTYYPNALTDATEWNKLIQLFYQHNCKFGGGGGATGGGWFQGKIDGDNLTNSTSIKPEFDVFKFNLSNTSDPHTAGWSQGGDNSSLTFINTYTSLPRAVKLHYEKVNRFEDTTFPFPLKFKIRFIKNYAEYTVESATGTPKPKYWTGVMSTDWLHFEVFFLGTTDVIVIPFSHKF